MSGTEHGTLSRQEWLETFREKLKNARETAHTEYLRKLAVKKLARKEQAAERRKNKITSSVMKCSGTVGKEHLAATASNVNRSKSHDKGNDTTRSVSTKQTHGKKHKPAAKCSTQAVSNKRPVSTVDKTLAAMHKNKATASAAKCSKALGKRRLAATCSNAKLSQSHSKGHARTTCIKVSQTGGKKHKSSAKYSSRSARNCRTVGAVSEEANAVEVEKKLAEKRRKARERKKGRETASQWIPTKEKCSEQKREMLTGRDGQKES